MHGQARADGAAGGQEERERGVETLERGSLPLLDALVARRVALNWVHVFSDAA